MKHWHNVCMVNHIYIDKMFAWDLKMCIHAHIAIWIFFWEYTIEISEGFVRFIAGVSLREGKTNMSIGIGVIWRLIYIDIQLKMDIPPWSHCFILVKIQKKNPAGFSHRDSLNQRQLIHSCLLELLKEPAWKLDPKLTQNGLILTNQKKGVNVAQHEQD